MNKNKTWITLVQDSSTTMADLFHHVEADLPKDELERLNAITSEIAAMLLQIAEIWVVGSILVSIVDKEKLYLRTGLKSVDEWATKQFEKSGETIRRWKKTGMVMSSLGPDAPRLKQDQYLKLAAIADSDAEDVVREKSMEIIESASYRDGSVDVKKLNESIKDKLPSKEVKLIKISKLVSDMKRHLENHIGSNSSEAEKAKAQKLLKAIESNA